MQFIRCAAGLVFFGLLVCGQAFGTLINIGTATYKGNNYSLIYDDNPSGSVVWMDYSNTDENWSNQMSWASSLNNAGEITYSILPKYTVNWSGNWQLPTTVDDAASRNFPPSPSSSQMAYLFYTQLGNTFGYGVAKSGPFTHLLNNEWYWSSTEYYEYPSQSAWYFYTNQGYNRDGNKIINHNPGMADRPATLQVTPEPATLLVLVAGLGGLACRRKRTVIG
jgi:hypothetical protein